MAASSGSHRSVRTPLERSGSLICGRRFGAGKKDRADRTDAVRHACLLKGVDWSRILVSCPRDTRLNPVLRENSVPSEFVGFWFLGSTWPGEGCRHDLALAYGGFLARHGVEEDVAAKLIEVAAGAPIGDEQVGSRVRAVRDSIEKYALRVRDAPAPRSRGDVRER